MITTHAYDRADERLDLNKKQAKQLIKQAFKWGKTADDFSSIERDYLRGKSIDGGIVIVYQKICYIFSQAGHCITMYKLPFWFGKRTF